MALIQSLKAIQVLDSRGLPTVSCKITLDNGITASSIVPSGASTGTKEALELRDGGDFYKGKGVEKAVNNINTLINPLLEKLDPRDQQLIDQKLIDLDGTKDKSNIGANAILAVSLAVSHAAAKDNNVSLHEHFLEIYQNITGQKVNPSLPMPMLNILNGGEHADNNIDIQEFMIIPKGANTFKEAMRWSSEIYWNLKSILKEKKLSTGVGDEGGFAPNLQSNEEAIKLIIEAINASNLIPGEDVFIALDCAASEFYDGTKYNLAGENKSLDSTAFANYLEELVDKYPIISIEDGMDEYTAPLQRVQIIKGYVDASGNPQEQVFDVACSDGGSPDPVTHRCPDNNAKVDISSCAFSQDVGAAELKAFWNDPTFKSGQRAFYYVRALENPTCRWSTWDAVRNNVEPRSDMPKTIQERVWSSPIHYIP